MGIPIISCTQWWIIIDNTTYKISACNLYKDYLIWDLSYLGHFLQNSCKRHLIIHPHDVIYLYWYVTCCCLVTCVQPLFLSCDLRSTCVIVIRPVFDHLMLYCAHYCVIFKQKYNHSQLYPVIIKHDLHDNKRCILYWKMCTSITYQKVTVKIDMTNSVDS